MRKERIPKGISCYVEMRKESELIGLRQFALFVMHYEGRSLAASGIGLLLICQAQNIVYAHMVVLGKGNQHLGRNHPLTGFVVCVGALGDIDAGTQLCLGQVGIFPEVADSFVSFSHFHHRCHYNAERIVLLK